MFYEKTHVAFPSLSRTHDSVQSSFAPLIFFVVGLRITWRSLCVDSTLACLRMFMCATASCLLFPVVGTYN